MLDTAESDELISYRYLETQGSATHPSQALKTPSYIPLLLFIFFRQYFKLILYRYILLFLETHGLSDTRLEGYYVVLFYT